MPDKIQEARRALFEKWFMANRPLHSSPELWLKTDVRGDYFVRETHTAWKAFNAALDAVEIELPEPHFEFDGDTCGELFDSQVRASIESTGLGLRIK